MKRTPVHPINPHIRNGFIADFYLNLVRKGNFYWFRRVLEHVLCTQITGSLPERLHIPHPYGIITGSTARIGEDVTLMQFSLLGGKDPWCQDETMDNVFPSLGEGVYVSAGAKILGPVTIGEWSVVGANAVVTENVPPYATVVGNNRILPLSKERNPQLMRYLESHGRL